MAPSFDLTKLKTIRPRDLVVRFILGGIISVTAAVLGKAVGPRFGGTFLAFPAILPAGLTLIEDKEGTRRADRNAIGAVLGGVGLTVFAVVGEATFTRVAPIVALALSLAAWVVAALGLYALLVVFRPETCDEQQD